MNAQLAQQAAMVEAQAKQIEALQSAEKTLLQLGYTNEGGEYWRPPIGKAPDFDLVDVWRTKAEALQADAERFNFAIDHPDWAVCFYSEDGSWKPIMNYAAIDAARKEKNV